MESLKNRLHRLSEELRWLDVQIDQLKSRISYGWSEYRKLTTLSEEEKKSLFEDLEKYDDEREKYEKERDEKKKQLEQLDY